MRTMHSVSPVSPRKRSRERRLAAAQIALPPGLILVPVNFERNEIAGRLIADRVSSELAGVLHFGVDGAIPVNDIRLQTAYRRFT